MASALRAIRSQQDIEVIEQTPLSQRLHIPHTYGVLTRSAEQYGDRIALQFLRQGNAEEEPVTFTYRELLARVTQTANLLHQLGVGPQDVVSFLLPNLPQTHFALWGSEACGIVNPINSLLEPKHIAGIMQEANTKVLIALGPEPNPEIWQKVATVAAEVPSLTTVLRVDLTPAQPGTTTLGPVQVLDFDEAINQQPADRLLSGRQIQGSDIASYFHTGGTTGTPKLAQHTHANEVYLAWVLQEMGDFTVDNTFFCGLPLFHVNAVLITGLAPFIAGARVVLLSPMGFRNPEVIRHFWPLVERYRASVFSAVPTIYAALLDVPMGGADVSSLRYGICGAAPMPMETYYSFQEQTGIKILEGYGLTEGTCASALNPANGERRLGSIGLRLPYQQMKAVKLDANGCYERDCAVDEIGAIVIKGPNVFPGYKQEDKNSDIWAADGWLNTGDLGRQDKDGYFWLTGRSKDLIIRGGHNIDPAIIEETLAQHPDVALAAAVGQPDGYAGELPVAYVTLRPGAQVDSETLREFARGRIPERAAAPVRVEILDALPTTAVGKIFKPALRHQAMAHVLTEALAAGHIAASVAVSADDRHGVLAQVRLQDPAQRQAAEKIASQFTVFCEFE